ncbi:WD40 repeat domain-containing protein [Streptomyces albogriseolus]|uniref:WD40 repeat domain-containing protein n=1 Tax=Streptomyces albogriseolus TaxID=1887 RepID=UPI0022536A92|nr:WD40 repeat domain-containing protein [Streptomyces viridodiastaticus]MCX4567532.1 WD40 repeat domain-containing protein [Streptomyces viridodiastaticus]
MRRPFVLLAAALLTAALAVPVSAADNDGGDEGFTINDPRVTESSGLAASRQHPGVYWTHNDSDDGPHLYAVDGSTGDTVARLTLTGIGTPRDVEAISVGPGDRLFVADVGDNLGGTWPYVWIYELPEPERLQDATVRATQYVVKYADGPRDAEAMVVHPKTGRVYLIDKHEDGGHLYEGPEKLSPSGDNVFRPVAPVELWTTDAALSPDGQHLAVRGYFGGIHYAWNGGKLEREGRLSVPLQGQGESVTYSADGSRLLFGSEGEQSGVVSRPAPGADEGGSSGGTGSRADGGGSTSGDGNGASVKVGGAVVVAVVVAALFGLGRRRRRG